MTDKKQEEVMEGSFSVDLSELRRPVDDLFPGAHRQISLAVGTCASPPFGCGNKIEGFRDAISQREYRITALCQSCQDRMYAALAEGEDDVEGVGEA